MNTELILKFADLILTLALALTWFTCYRVSRNAKKIKSKIARLERTVVRKESIARYWLDWERATSKLCDAIRENDNKECEEAYRERDEISKRLMQIQREQDADV